MRRREFLSFSAIALCIPLVLSAQEQAVKISYALAYKSFTQGKPVKTDADIITLTIADEPPSAKSIPVEVSIDHAMNEQNYIETIAVLPTNNPVCRAVEFHLTPKNGRAYLSCNIKLASSQKVVILARDNKGQIYQHAKEVHVALSGCA